MHTARLNNEQVVGLLNTLLETCRDGEFGFDACARHVDSPELREVFSMRAADCQRAARELETYVAEYGGTPDSGGTAAGALHRGWVELKGSLAPSSDLAMLEECERGEDTALERYREAARQPLPDAVRVVVERQMHGVERNHEQIRRLRDRYAG